MATVPAEATLPAGASATAFSSLFQAVQGLRNWRAIIALVGCTVAGILVAGALLLTSGTLGFLAGLLAFLVYLVAVGTGVNAAGLLHMDYARGISPRSTVDAIVHGLMCIPKLIVLGLAFIAVEIAFFIVLALILLICKIPFLGPLLFTVVFPLSVVAAGVTICGLFLCMLLSLPAIWQGATITRALAQTLAIARSRLIEALLLLVGIGFLSFAVGLVIFGVLGIGLLPTVGMSAGIIGFGGLGSLGSIMGMAGGGGGGGGGGAGHAIAGGIGFAVLWALAASLVGQVYLLGLCIVYLRVTDGLDLTGTEAALRQKLDEARRRTAEFSEKARSATARESAPEAPSTRAAGASVAAAGASAVAPAFAPPPAPAYTAPPPAYSAPPPAYSAPPPAYRPPPSVDPAADIVLPFDDVPAAAPTPPAPAWSAPPAYMPPPTPPAVTAPPAAAAPTTCPQCLSPVTAEDVFCGVCGFRVK